LFVNLGKEYWKCCQCVTIHEDFVFPSIKLWDLHPVTAIIDANKVPRN
jgi:hypothetical protein